jgi:hypothetical protein
MTEEYPRESSLERKPSRILACDSCGNQVERRARQQRFCSARCKEKARTRIRTGVSGKTRPAPNLPTDPPKTSIISRGLRAKITAPAHVIEGELWDGREWRPSISSSGLPIEVGQLRARVLVS